MEVICPTDMKVHVNKVLQGEYDIGFDFNPSVILDIGANVGAFAVWARNKWKNATIVCYEPVPTTFQYLMKNCGKLGNIDLNNVAVSETNHTKIRLGKNNIGEASFFDTGGVCSETVDIKTIHPKDLPECNFLKVDTEGSELDIIPYYLREIRKPEVVAFEFHSESDRFLLDKILHDDYTLVAGQIIASARGTLKYVLRSALR